MERLFVMPERSKSICSPSRDEELTPMPAGKWFCNLKAAFEWADSSNLLGDLFGWHANVYLLTAKKWTKITKVTKQMIYEDELHEALEGLTASYNPEITWRVMIKSGGGTNRIFAAGFKDEYEAEQFAEFYDWQWKDENDFVWDMYVEEDLCSDVKRTCSKH